MLRAIVLVLSLCTLSACSNFRVIQPEEGTVFTNARLPIQFEGNPSISNPRVMLGTTDLTTQGSYAGSNRWQADVPLPNGEHILSIETDVPCWYCSGQSFRHRATVAICGAPATASTALLKTPAAQGDGQSWASVDAKTIKIEADANNARTRWNFRRLGGITSSDGLIESAAFPCHCLRSMEATQGAAIGFSACNINDTLQRWQALEMPPGSGRYRIQNRGRGVSDACLTEGPAPERLLVQRGCNDTPEQLWTVRNNSTGQNGSPFF